MVLFTNGDEYITEESKMKIFFNRVRKWRRETTTRKENERGEKRMMKAKPISYTGHFKPTYFIEPCLKCL